MICFLNIKQVPVFFVWNKAIDKGHIQVIKVDYEIFLNHK